jgi:outer membrane receptor for monomeric catechols
MTDAWRWNAGYTWLQQTLRPKPGSFDLNQAHSEISDPEHQFQVGSSVDLTAQLQLDLGLRRVGTVPAYAGGVRTTVPAYTELDAQLAWQFRPQLQLAVGGHNLLHAHHPEAGAPANRREIERSVYGKATWRY